MSSFDGEAERAAIKALLAPIGQVVEIMPDAAQSISEPFVVFQFGSPFASANDRSLAGERQQPQRVAITISGVAADIDTAKAMDAAITNALMDVRPTPNSTALAKDGGYTLPQLDAQNKPSRVVCGSYWRLFLNFEPDDVYGTP